MKVEDYLSLPYTIEVVRDEGDHYSGWFAQIVELPGCMTQADSFAELDEMIKDAMVAWIETALEDGQKVPLPQAFEEVSGRITVQIPKSLHHELIELAEQEGVNLNMLVNATLGKVVGQGRKSGVDEVVLAA